MAPAPTQSFQPDTASADTSLWKEALFAADILLLHSSPIYYGLGVPRGDGSPVLLLPGFLGTDRYLGQLHAWLSRIGYKPFFSRIGFNAECPNLLIQRRLNESVDDALAEGRGKVHLIGHSLGGIIARAVADQRPDDIASVTTLGSPFRGTVIHRTLLHAAEAVRARILEQHGEAVLPTCYTGHCTCAFLSSLRRSVPASVLETAIYTRADGVADWRYCVTGNAENDFEVPGTHIGLAFNAAAYGVIATRLTLASQRKASHH